MLLLTILLLWIASGRVGAEKWAQEIQVADVRLLVPPGWEVRDLQGVKVLLTPVEGPRDVFRENLTVLSEPLSQPLASAQYAQLVAKRLAQALQAFRPGEMRHVRVGSVEAVEFTAQGSVEGMNLEWVIWAFVIGQQGYQVTFTGEPGKFPRYQAEVHTALASLSTSPRISHLGPPAGAAGLPPGPVAPPATPGLPPGPVAPPAIPRPPAGGSLLVLHGMLEPGLPVQGKVGGPQDNFRTYVVDVPAGVEGLTIELQAETDLDLFVRHGQPMENWEQDPEYQDLGPTGRKVITITLQSHPPLRPGIYFIDVANLTGGPGGTFTLTVRLQPGSSSP